MPQSLDSIRAEEEASRAEWEAKTVGAVSADGERFTIAQLRAAFEAVENRDHWKNPIDADVHADVAVVTSEAIVYFHGRRPSHRPGSTPSHVRMTSAGYAG